MAYCVVLMTAPDEKSASGIAQELVRRKLAACVNQVPGVTSRYWWEGKIETAKEHLLVAKTRSALVAELIECVKGLHPYKVPEIVAFPIARGHRPYLEWVGANTLFTRPAERPRHEPAR